MKTSHHRARPYSLRQSREPTQAQTASLSRLSKYWLGPPKSKR